MLLPAANLLVKMCLERSAERDKHENKNKISAEYGLSLIHISEPTRPY